jgi:serine/threonine protein kinase
MGLDFSRLFRLDLGKPLGGRYRVIDQLGAGGFSQTFLAEDLHLPGHPRCVVKQLKPQVSDTAILQTARRLFDTEAQVLYKLGNHNQIPHLLAHFEDNREFYLVLELIEGESLTEELIPGEPWTEAQVVVLLRDVLDALSFVHQENVIHRDIKPSNLIRRRHDGKVVLIDFGAVKQTTAKIANPDTGPTVTISIGTQGYMPNEQLAGNPRFSSDIFALGMIGVQALTGVHPRDLSPDPYTGEFDWQPYIRQNQVHLELRAILDRMIRYHFKDRYQTAREALKALNDFLDNYPDIAEAVEAASFAYQATAQASEMQIPAEQTENVAVVPDTMSSDLSFTREPHPPFDFRALPWKVVASLSIIAVLAATVVPAWIKSRSQSVAEASLVQALPCQDEPSAPLPDRPDYVYDNGIQYYGPLTNGVPATSGEVTMIFPNGNRYSGRLANGKRNGCGSLYFANGRRYVGEFQDDQFSGQGIWTLENGDRYVGEFKDNRCHGEGTFIFADGTSKQGTWQNGSLTGADLSCDR